MNSFFSVGFFFNFCIGTIFLSVVLNDSNVTMKKANRKQTMATKTVKRAKLPSTKISLHIISRIEDNFRLKRCGKCVCRLHCYCSRLCRLFDGYCANGVYIIKIITLFRFHLFCLFFKPNQQKNDEHVWFIKKKKTFGEKQPHKQCPKPANTFERPEMGKLPHSIWVSVGVFLALI